MHETLFDAVPYDVDITPNGVIAVVRGNSNAVAATSGTDDRASFWRTDVTSSALAKLAPNQTSIVGRGNLTTSNTIPGFPPATFSNAIAVNNERAVLIGSADTTGDQIEDTTYVDIVSFDYTQSPPTVTVLSTATLGPGINASTMAGLAHDVAITPDGTLAVVSHRNWIHVFAMTTGAQVAAFNVGGPGSPSGAGPCSPGFSRNSLEVTNDHAVVTMSRAVPSAPANSATWVYALGLSYSPPTTLPTLVLEHEPFSGTNQERKPHDLAISPNGTLAGISSYNMFALYDLAAPTPTYVGGNYNALRWKETLGCGKIWDTIEMSDARAVVLSNRGTPPTSGGTCPWKYWWTAQVFRISSTEATLLNTFDDSALFSEAQYGGSEAFDIAMSDDGKIAAIHGGFTYVAIVDVDTTPVLQRLGGYGAPPGAPGPEAPGLPINPAYRWNDTVVISRGYITQVTYPPPVPPPASAMHRWITYLHPTLLAIPQGQPTISRVIQFDLPQYLAGNPEYQYIFHSDPGNDTWGVDLEPNGSQTEVLVRNIAPPDESNPAAGGRDWYQYSTQSSPPIQLGSALGGKGTSIGVDNLIQRRGVVVSISAHTTLVNKGYVHVVRSL